MIEKQYIYLSSPIYKLMKCTCEFRWIVFLTPGMKDQSKTNKYLETVLKPKPSIHKDEIFKGTTFSMCVDERWGKT